MTASRPHNDEISNAYTVGRFVNGPLGWWPNSESYKLGGAIDTRPATSEEATLMDKCMWGTATSADMERLREMLK